MKDLTMQTMLGIFVSPECYQFELQTDVTKGEKKYGVKVYRDGEMVWAKEPFTKNFEHVFVIAKDILETAQKIGELKQNANENALNGSQTFSMLENLRSSYHATSACGRKTV